VLAIGATGKFAGNLVLRTILGRAPRTLDSYLGELAGVSNNPPLVKETP
jgi:hypothetical protein